MIDVRFHGGAVTEGVLGLAAAARGATPTWCPEIPERARAAVEAAGDPTGEVWFHLLGLAIEQDERAGLPAFVQRAAALEPTELLEHVLGVHVPAWRECVDPQDLTAAATGDTAATARLLASDRYYGGHADRALRDLLAEGPEAARRRIVTAVERWFADVVAPARAEIDRRHREVDRDVPEDEEPLATVQRVSGFRFEPESYTDTVVLVPQFVGREARVLAQHEAVRIVAYDASGTAPDDLPALAEVFAALGEVKRLEMLRHLATTPGGVSDLARETGLAKSTTHRHLKLLRDAGLVELAGQAWRYRYEVRIERLQVVVDRLTAALREEERA